MNEYTHPTSGSTGSTGALAQSTLCSRIILALSITSGTLDSQAGAGRRHGSGRLLSHGPLQAVAINRLSNGGLHAALSLKSSEMSPEEFDAKRASLEELLVPAIFPS